MIYIFDTTHETQFDKTFKCKLKKIIIEKKIVMIAEEAYKFNTVRKFKNGKIIQFKTNAFLYHINNRKIRYTNIENSTFHVNGRNTNDSIRENFWLNEIKKYNALNVLLIIGYGHYKSFTKKLNKKNIKFRHLNSFCIHKNQIIFNKEYFSHSLLKETNEYHNIKN